MSQVALSLKNLTNALNKVEDWEGLGIQLDIEYHELQKIFKDRSSTEERKRAMLQFWLKNGTKPSWETLIAALGKLNLKNIAEEVKQEYQVPSSTQLGDSPLVPENATSADTLRTDPPSSQPNDQPEQTSATRVMKMQQEIATLVDMYDDLVAKAGVFLSRQQAISPDFLIEFRTRVAVLPTSLKYQHKYFLAHHSSQIAKATTVEEILCILNTYCNFLNCSLLVHIINKFGDEELQKQLSSYTQALQSFRLRTKISDFIKACKGNPNLPPEFVVIKTKMGSEWQHRTLEEAEEYRKSIAHDSSVANYALYLVAADLGSIYLVWSVPSHAIGFVVVAMSSEFLKHHCIEEVTIDGQDLKEYKHQHYYSFSHFKMPLNELSEGLIWASREGYLEGVVFLLSIGVEVNSRGQWRGRTALMQASKGGHMDVVEELLRARAGVDLQDENGDTAIIKATRKGHVDVIRELLLGAAQVDLRTENDWTALILASREGHTDIIRELLLDGAQVDLQTQSGMTALMWASHQGHTDIIRELLLGGAQVDLQTQNGDTALMEASRQGHPAIIRELLSGGAQVDLHNMDGWSALIWASFLGKTDAVRELLSGGAQVDLQDKNGWTALRWAIVMNHPEIVRELLSGGAQVNLQDEDGQTALIFAVQEHHTETVKMLLAVGADVNLQEKVKEIKAICVDVDACTHSPFSTSGRSAVFSGAEKGDLEMVKLLIQGGANLSLKDKDGVTADEVAEVNGHQAVCEELRNHMHGGHRPLSKTVHDRVLATGQFLRALYKRLEERILRTQKRELASRTQGPDPEIPFPTTPKKKGVKEPSKRRQQEEYVLSHLY